MVDAPGQPPVVAKSLQTHTPPDPCTGTLALKREHARSYDNDGRTSRHQRRRARHTTLRITQ